MSCHLLAFQPEIHFKVVETTPTGKKIDHMFETKNEAENFILASEITATNNGFNVKLILEEM